VDNDTDGAARGRVEARSDPVVGVHSEGQVTTIRDRAAAMLGRAHAAADRGVPDFPQFAGPFSAVDLDLPEDHPSYPDASNIWPPAGWPLGAAPPASPLSPPPLTAASAGRQAPAPRGATAGQPPTDPAREDALAELETLGHLAGTVAHDVNNLLTVIRNYATFVATALDDALDANGSADADRRADADRWEAMRRDVAQIQRAGDRAAELTAELLAAARSGCALARPVDVNSLVGEVIGMLRRPLGERTVIRLELDDALWPVAIDPARLEQAIVNLAMNARDAMPRGGTLTVMTGNVVGGGPPDAAVPAFTPRRPGAAGTPVEDAVDTALLAPPPDAPASTGRRYVSIWVSDTGEGMTAATRACAFEPFFTTKPEGRGTGLGLAVVRDVVTQAGGDVQIFSTVGAGTTVSLLLPAEARPAGSADDARPGRRSAHGSARRGVDATSAVSAPTVPSPAAPPGSRSGSTRPGKDW
jgi:signal transduction histidine kinase